MSTAAGTRIFGVKVTLDPKIIIGGLVVIAGVLYWINSGSDDTPAPTTAAVTANTTAATPSAVSTRSGVTRRRSGAPAQDRSALAMRAIDGSHGDVDPTLRLDLLKRLNTIQLSPASRSLFEIGSTLPAAIAAGAATPIKGPKILVNDPKLNAPLTAAPQTSINTVVSIPLKYYGYVKPSTTNATNQGLFLDGDNVIVASEGETIKSIYLVVELTPNSARMENTQLKQGQTLPVVPVATTP